MGGGPDLTVTFNAQRSTSTSVDCPVSLALGEGGTCTATVTDTASGTKSDPTGSVDFTRSGVGTGSFSAASCALVANPSPSIHASTCSVTYTPNAGTGNHVVTGTYNETSSATHATSSGNDTITVILIATTTAITSDTPDPSTVGQAYTVTATVTRTSGSAAITGTMSISDGTDSCTDTTPDGGSGSPVTYFCELTSTTAGVKTLTASYPGNSTYGASSGTAAHTVRANQTITFGALGSKTYGDAPFTVSATASSGLTVTFSTTTPSVCTSGGTNGATITIISAGTCTVQADQAGNGSFAAAPSVQQTFTIEPKQLIAEVTADDKVYDGDTDATFTCALIGVVGLDDVDCDTSGASASFADPNVGTGKTVTATGLDISGADSGNYLADSSDTDTADIDQADLTVTAVDQTKVYGSLFVFDQTTPSTDFTVVGLVNADTVDSVTLTSTGAAAGATVAGSPYPIVVSAAVGTGLGNYDIDYVNGELEVTPKDLTVTAVDQTKVYGSLFVFDQTTPSTDFTVVGLVNADTVDSVTLTSTGAAAGATVAGSPYPIVVSAAVGTGLGNYDIDYVNGELEVTPKDLTVTAVDQTKVYGSLFVFDQTTPSTDFTVVGLVNADTVDSVTLTSTGAAAGATVAGSPYPIVVSAAVGTGLGNYDIDYVNGELEVTPKDLTVTAVDQTKVYGSLFVFDQTTPSTDFTVVGLVNADTVDSVTLTSTGAAAGATVAGSPYPIVVSAAVGTGLGNYDIDYVNGELEVTPKDLTVTAVDQTKVYGSLFVFDQTTPSTDFTVVGLVNADTVDSVTLTSTGAAAGATVAGSPYPIVVSAAVGTGLGNYDIDYVNGELEVTPKDLTVTAVDQTKVYGSLFVFDQTTPSTDFTVVGLVNADTVDSVTLTSTGAAAGATVAGSPYPIVVSAAVGTGLGNYDIDYVNGELEVTPKDLTVTAVDQTKVYGSLFVFDQTTPSTDFTVVGLVNADTVDSVTLTSTGAAAGATVAGSPYPIVVSAAVGTGLGNYDIDYVNGELEVTPKDLTVTAVDQTKVYGSLFVFDQTTPSTDFTVVGLVNADTVDSVTLTSTGAAAGATVAGSPYPIVVSAAVGTGLGNYDIDYVNGELEVTPKDLTVTAVDQTKVYGSLFVFDQTTPSTDFTVVGLVNADTVDSVTLTSTGAAAGATVAGSPYPIVVSAAVGTGLGNYDIDYVNGELEVTPKDLTVTAVDQTKVYGSLFVFDQTTPSTDFTVVGLVNADTVDSVTLTSTGAAAGATVAGSPYPIVVSAAVGTGLGNYDIDYVNGELEVTPKDLTVTAVDQTKVYGSLFVFDQTTPSTDFTVVGLVNADTVDSVTLTSTGAAAGATVAGSPYPIVVSAAVGTGLGNYDIDYVNGELEVTPKDLTVTAVDQTKVYGSLFVFDQTTPSTDFTVVGLVNADTVDSVTLTSTGAAAGATVAGSPYPIVVSAAVGTGLGNYDIDYVNGELEVTPKDLTVTAVDQTRQWGVMNPVFTFVYSGFVAGDDGSDIDTPPTCSTTATQFSLIGTYPITCSGGADVNYTFTYVAGTLTITTAYTFTGFFSPIDNPPMVNQANAGRTIPTKWRLTTTSGVAVSDPNSFVSLTSRLVTCGTFSGAAPDEIETYVGNSGLQYQGNGNWHYNWATPKSYAGQCRIMTVTMNDGSTHTANFKFK